MKKKVRHTLSPIHTPVNVRVELSKLVKFLVRVKSRQFKKIMNFNGVGKKGKILARFKNIGWIRNRRIRRSPLSIEKILQSRHVRAIALGMEFNKKQTVLFAKKISYLLKTNIYGDAKKFEDEIMSFLKRHPSRIPIYRYAQ